MQPINILRHLKRDMIEYVSSKYPFLERERKDLDAQLKKLLSREGVLFQDVVLQLVRGRRRGTFELSSFHAKIQGALLKNPYLHQIKAWKNIQQGTPTVVATGTGSGKSECFIFPVIDGLLKAGHNEGAPRVGALFLYPMNALVEDQFFRIHAKLKGTGLRVGIYNGSFKRLSKGARDKVIEKLRRENPDIDPDTVFVDPEDRKTIPHILLTNYKMLEYMLLRSGDQGLFEDIDLRYLVLDEAHTYTGTLGLEIACLLARLRVHLGNRAANVLPVATSATLVQSSSATKHAQNNSTYKEDMRRFFSELFGLPFPNDKEWLIEDEFEPLDTISTQAFQAFLKVDPKFINSALDQPFPKAMIDLARLFCAVELKGDGSRDNYRDWGKSLFPHVKSVAKQLPTVLLCSEPGATPDPVVTWKTAVERFVTCLGGNPAHLEGLLVLCSQAIEQDERWPALGLRLHLFGRAEPRVFWTFDQQTLVDEKGLALLDKIGCDFVSCRKCGHMAWGGRYIPTGEGQETARLEVLPHFYEDANLRDGSEVFVLHSPNDVSEEVFERKGWKAEWYELDPSSNSRSIKFIPEKSREKRGDLTNIFIRVTREDKEGDQVTDTNSCPSCGETSGKGERPILMTPRGGAATDIGVYGASVMTALDLPDERRLLVFSDNRQETAFLAGWLSDRHRRLNLRRAIATFLWEAEKESDSNPWIFEKEVNTEETPAGHRFDFTARILLSIKEGKYWGRKDLPKRFEISKRVLTDLIPKDVLEVDFLDRQDRDQERNNDFKNWLLDNVSIGEADSEKGNKSWEDVELFDSERGRWCLGLFHEVILLEISSLIGREGSLQALGLATWYIKDFNDTQFRTFEQEHPELKLNARGLFILSRWLLGRLAEHGQWQGLDKSTRRHALGKKGMSRLLTLVELLGKGANTEKGISKNSSVGRILAELGGEDARKAWSKESVWVHLIEKGPLEKFVSIAPQDKCPRIKTRRIEISPKVQAYKGTKSGTIISVHPSMDLEGIPTGKKGDFWARTEIPNRSYYKVLYQRSFSEESRLIRALEHNGMLGANLAMEVLRHFENGTINTLVATPTLEMGVDLPDLPVVIHRSVPPDPSNYAQRSGRAGRDPKRAFIITHCGLGSHDLTFYNQPELMVSGEILPPGLPTENVSILVRHTQGLVLELLAINISGQGSQLDFRWLGDLVDLTELKKRYVELGGDPSGLPDSRPLDWLTILRDRKDLIENGIKMFIGHLTTGLWSGLPDSRKELLRRKIEEAGNIDHWANAIRRELQGYQERVKGHLAEFEKWVNKPRESGTREQENMRQFRRSDMLARMFLSDTTESNYPLAYLASVGFLPHFDFPGRSTRFTGVLPQFQTTDSRKVGRNEKYLNFERSSEVALREFAPEQRVYGQGFVYRVDRYVAEGTTNPDDGRTWGICTQHCSQLSPPEAKVCKFCEAELVFSGEEKRNQPRLIAIQEAHGLQEAVISDRDSKREFNRTVQDIRRLGIPVPDEAYSLSFDESIIWTKHLSENSQIRTVTFLSSSVVSNGEGEQRIKITPVYKEISETDAKVFSVRLQPSQEEAARFEPFLPSVFGKGQALMLKLPFSIVEKHGFMNSAEVTDADAFYKTVGELISRAAQRVLRLNKRRTSLRIIDDKIKTQAGDGKFEVSERHLLILDTEEGGSGVIELVWNYWDAILDEAERLAIKPCCNDGCYECVKSFDNQWYHHMIKKSLVVFGENEKRTAPFFVAMKLHDKSGRSNLRSLDASKERTVDPLSPAEKVFEEYLRSEYPLGRETQTSTFNLSGREVTRPDFVLETAGNDKVVLFVDGAAYHSDFETMLADIEKRNFLTRQGARVMSLPGSVFLPNVDRTFLAELLGPLQIQGRRLEVSATGRKLEHLPFSVDPETLRNVQGSLFSAAKWAEIDQTVMKQKLTELVTSNRSKNSIQAIDEKYLPVAIQEGVLLCPVYGAEIFSGSTTRAWENVLVLQSILVSLGFRVMGVWVGSRRKASAA